MTDIVFNKDKKGNVENVIIKGGIFYYTNIKNPRPVFDDRKLPYDKARKEYSVDVAVSEEVADAWDEVFAKQPSKKYTNAKFMEKYKLDDKSQLPFPDEKKQFTIKITQKAQKNDGEAIHEKLIPRALVVEGGKAVDITFEKLIGNGSKGDVLVRSTTNDYGSFAYLYRLKVTDLLEYEADSDADEKDFLGVDEIEYADAPERKTSSGGSSASDDDEEGDQGGDDYGVDPDDF